MSDVQQLFWQKLENSINRILATDADAISRLYEISGGIYAIEFTDINVSIYLFPTSDKIKISSHYEGDVHAIIQGSSLAIVNMAVRAHSEDSLFTGDVEIKGDIEMGQKLKDFFAAIDIDWEEQIAQITGDVVAHKLANAFRQGLSVGKQIITTLGMDAVEYFQYEDQVLPDKIELNRFIENVDLIRGDMDRMEARIQRLNTEFGNQF